MAGKATGAVLTGSPAYFGPASSDWAGHGHIGERVSSCALLCLLANEDFAQDLNGLEDRVAVARIASVLPADQPVT